MKKLFLLSAFVAASFITNAQQKAGKIFVQEDKGKSFQLGSEKSVQTVLKAVDAFNAVDHDAEVLLWSDEYVKRGGEGHKKSMETLKSVSNKPMAMVPIKVEGSSNEIVLVQSTEDRVFKNGSKQSLNFFEMFFIDEAGKIENMVQYSSIPATNEFGKTSGGKYIDSTPGSEVNGRALQFSNRGEVAAIENWAKANNAMDVQGVFAVLADVVTVNNIDGSIHKMTKESLSSWFANYASIDWKPIIILPFKIKDTDPASGIMVYSTEKRVKKDGTVWEKNLMEIFSFNLDGKIDTITQFSREKSK
jgi:hypothetical protein